MIDKLLSLIKEYPVLAGKQKKEALETLLGFDDAEISAYEEAYGELSKSSTAVFSRCMQKKKQL